MSSYQVPSRSERARRAVESGSTHARPLQSLPPRSSRVHKPSLASFIRGTPGGWRFGHQAPSGRSHRRGLGRSFFLSPRFSRDPQQIEPTWSSECCLCVCGAGLPTTPPLKPTSTCSTDARLQEGGVPQVPREERRDRCPHQGCDIPPAAPRPPPPAYPVSVLTRRAAGATRSLIIGGKSRGRVGEPFFPSSPRAKATGTVKQGGVVERGDRPTTIVQNRTRAIVRRAVLTRRGTVRGNSRTSSSPPHTPQTRDAVWGRHGVLQPRAVVGGLSCS